MFLQDSSKPKTVIKPTHSAVNNISISARRPSNAKPKLASNICTENNATKTLLTWKCNDKPSTTLQWPPVQMVDAMSIHLHRQTLRK